MPYKPMMLRGKQVFAKCDESGELLAERGRVEIRYGKKSRKFYSASVRNLKSTDGGIEPDSSFVVAEDASAGKDSKGKKKSSKKKSATSKTPPPTVPKEGEALAYCDGACSGNPGPCGLGAVIRVGGKERVLSEYLGSGTNNIAELTAIQRVAEGMEDPSVPLTIYTDSSYSIGVLTKGWKAKKNIELIASVKEALARLSKVNLEHVKGHAGMILNELADALAVQAVERRDAAKGVEWIDRRYD